MRGFENREGHPLEPTDERCENGSFGDVGSPRRGGVRADQRR